MLSAINILEKQKGLIESIVNKELNLYLNYFGTLIFNLFNKYNLQINSPPPSSLKLKRKKVIKSGSVNTLCLLRNGRLVSGGIEGIKIYHEYTPHIFIEEESIVLSVCGLRNGNLASGDYHGDIKIYEIEENEYKHTHTLKGHSSSVNKVIELEDGRLCSCSDDKTIIIWDENYQPIKILTEHSYSVYNIIEMNDYIISFAKNNGVRIWNKQTYECIKVIQHLYCCGSNSLSKLGENTIILGGENKLFVLDILSFQSKSFQDKRLREIKSILVLREDKILLGNWGEIICYDSLSNQIIFIQNTDARCINCIFKTEDNKILLCFIDGNINVYD